jgi:hypothetical protein
MAYYKKKPVIISAFQLGIDKFPDWFEKAVMDGTVSPFKVNTSHIATLTDAANETHYHINTLEGEIRADYKDFIIKGVEGELYPCKPSIFAKTYETVEDAPKPGINDEEIAFIVKASHGVITAEIISQQTPDMQKAVLPMFGIG